MIEVDGAAVMCSNQLVVVVGQFGGGGGVRRREHGLVSRVPALARVTAMISLFVGASRVYPHRRD